MAESFLRSCTRKELQWFQQYNRTNRTRKLPPDSPRHAKGARTSLSSERTKKDELMGWDMESLDSHS